MRTTIGSRSAVAWTGSHEVRHLPSLVAVTVASGPHGQHRIAGDSESADYRSPRIELP